MSRTRADVREAVHALAGRDAVLDRLIHRHGPPQIRGPAAASARFPALARAICYQQLNGRAAASIHQRLHQCLDGTITPDAVLARPPAALRACGLSAAKEAAIRDLASKVAHGSLRLERIGRLPDHEVVRQLVEVRGIGRWTAEMFLMSTLGRLDVWPTGDFGVRAGFGRAWGLPGAPGGPALAQLGEPFRPYRTVVAWYCWRVMDDSGG